MGSFVLNISFMTYGFATLAYCFLLMLIVRSDQRKEGREWLLSAVVVSVIWGLLNSTAAIAGAYTTNLSLLFISYLLPFADWLKATFWIIFLYDHMKEIWNSQGNQRASKNVGGLLTAIISIGFVVELINLASLWGIFEHGILGDLPLYNKFILAFGVLFLIENLYRNIANENRWGIRLFCLGLGSVYAFDFLLYGDTIFYSLIDPQLYDVRGAVNFLIVPLMAVALSRKPNWSIGISLSRKAAFHMVSLIAGVAYLVAISVVGYYIQSVGGEWGKLLQVSFLFGAFVSFLAIIYSGKIRSIVLVWLNKYFFSYKFDYREEWLRFIGTMTASEDHYNLQGRAIKSVADIMDCRGGALWYLEHPDAFSQIARWNFNLELDEDLPAKSPFARYLAANHWIVDLDNIESNKIPNSDCEVPVWLQNDPELWLVIPLIHHHKMNGFIVLSGPRTVRELNWETIDILKTVSLQIASYLAEQESHKALSIASEFEAFNRKFAFVIHDIKNMASQLSLLHRNADKHGNNPDFQEDMKLTVKNTVEKMDSLLSRINIIQEPSVSKDNESINIHQILSQCVAKFINTGREVEFTGKENNLFIRSNLSELETIFMHIIQNALDASAEDTTVLVSLAQEDKYAIIKIEDYGEGMSRDFIRDELFRPFRSLKEGGYGIGAYESRQLIHKMGGRMEVKSRLAAGTIVTVYLKKEL